jgi:hypothetical protein
MNKENRKKKRSPVGNPHVTQNVCYRCGGSGKTQSDEGYFDAEGYYNHYIIMCPNPHCVDGYDQAYTCEECSSCNSHKEVPVEDDWDQTFWFLDRQGPGCTFCMTWVVPSDFEQRLAQAQAELSGSDVLDD